jgi:biotin carboxyl carrier protein
VMVEVIVLKAARAPAVYSGAAQKIVSREEAWLYPGLEGVVETLPVLHEKVEKDTLIATLVMPEAVAKKFKEAHEVYDTTLERVEFFERVLEDLEKKRASLIDKIQEEKEAVKKFSEGPKSFKNLSQVDAKKKHIARYNKMLSALAQQKSAPSNNVKKQRELLEKARVVLEKAKQEASPYRVYAPFSGTVVDIAAKQGDAVKPETRLLFLADIEATHAVFASENKASMQTGGVVQVILPGEPPLDATVKKTDGQQVTVEIADPKHVLRKRKPEEFFLVREFVEGAFSVPKTAVMKKNNGMFVWLLDKEQETVRAVDVEWLSEEGDFFRVRDLTGTLQDLKHVVVGCAAPCVSIGAIEPGRLVRRAGQH